MKIGRIILALALFATAAASAQDTDTADEAQLGAQTFEKLKSQGVIVASSPLYDELRPIERALVPITRQRYNYPIQFYIVHSKQPNAFAAPGGNVYVVDSLMYFVHNREELAGTLCHETSHLINHDSVNEMKHDEEIERREMIGEILLGPDFGTTLAASILGDLDSLHFSRSVEERADLEGADTCAAAALNPWGLVWLMKDFENADLQSPPEILSDHPDNAHRIERLEEYLKNNPARFARFSSDPKHATLLNLPKKPTETILPPTRLASVNGASVDHKQSDMRR